MSSLATRIWMLGVFVQRDFLETIAKWISMAAQITRARMVGIVMTAHQATFAIVHKLNIAALPASCPVKHALTQLHRVALDQPYVSRFLERAQLSACVLLAKLTTQMFKIVLQSTNAKARLV